MGRGWRCCRGSACLGSAPWVPQVLAGRGRCGVLGGEEVGAASGKRKKRPKSAKEESGVRRRLNAAVVMGRVVQVTPLRSFPSPPGAQKQRAATFLRAVPNAQCSLTPAPLVLVAPPAIIRPVTWSGPRWKVTRGGRASSTTIPPRGPSCGGRGNPPGSTCSSLMTAPPGAGSASNT